MRILGAHNRSLSIVPVYLLVSSASAVTLPWHPDGFTLEQHEYLLWETVEVQRLTNKAIEPGCARPCFILRKHVGSNCHDQRVFQLRGGTDIRQNRIAVLSRELNVEQDQIHARHTLGEFDPLPP